MPSHVPTIDLSRERKPACLICSPLAPDGLVPYAKLLRTYGLASRPAQAISQPRDCAGQPGHSSRRCKLWWVSNQCFHGTFQKDRWRKPSKLDGMLALCVGLCLDIV